MNHLILILVIIIIKSETRLLHVLYIQMELCHTTLYDAINEMNKTLNQCKEKGISLIGYYISQELFRQILLTYKKSSNNRQRPKSK
jgi:hypothetical protein